MMRPSHALGPDLRAHYIKEYENDGYEQQEKGYLTYEGDFSQACFRRSPKQPASFVTIATMQPADGIKKVY